MGFAAAGDSPIVRSMESPDTALEEARRAGIDLDLLDSNLALTYEQRVLRHERGLKLVEAFELNRGKPLSETAVIRWRQSGGQLWLEAREGDSVWRIGYAG
jgi:hypothetical protein